MIPETGPGVPAEALAPLPAFSRSPRLRADLSSRLACLLLSGLFLGVFQAPSVLSTDVKSLLDQARIHEKAEDYSGAERTYRQALTLAPDDPEVLKRLGILYQTELKFPESIELFRRALSNSPQHPEVNFFLGASYLGSNQFQKATESFQAELSTPNPHPRCHYYNAIALVSLGRPDDAITQFNRSLARNPKDADALYQLGRLHMNASLEIIQRLTDLDPDSFQLHALIGEVYANNKRYEDSLRNIGLRSQNVLMHPGYTMRWELPTET